MKVLRFVALAMAASFFAIAAAAQEYEIEDVREAIENGDTSSQQLALQLYYAQLFSGGAARTTALALARELEPYLVEPAARAEFQERVATSFHETGDLASYEEFLGRMQAENPDPSTEWGFHARYTRAFEYLQRQDFRGAESVLEPLLPYAENISGNQRGRIGVQLTNLYRNNQEHTKAITLAELTRSHLDDNDPRKLDLLADLAASYYATENYDLAALTYDELAALAKSINPDAQLPNPAANYRIFAPQRAAEAREIAAAFRNTAPAQAIAAGPAGADASASKTSTAAPSPSGSGVAQAPPPKPQAVSAPLAGPPMDPSSVTQGAAVLYAAFFSSGALIGAAVVARARQTGRARRRTS